MQTELVTLDWNEVHSFFQNHTITALTSSVVKYIPKEFADIKNKWKEAVYSNVYYYSQIEKQQQCILDVFHDKHILVVVVKGTSAAKYYHKPQLRAMGDIDLLVKPIDYTYAVKCMIDTGCIETTEKAEEKRGRHRSFQYKDVSIELHHYFALSEDQEKADIFDKLIFDAMPTDNTVLPNDENGLILLSHIRQHLDEGLGLRQIIDWMMFLRSCLDDEVWYTSFKEKAHITGLEKLAITTTKMCQKYLGLLPDSLTWCKEANEEVCDELMQYVMECGNFGRNRTALQSTEVRKFPQLFHLVQLFKYLQLRGERHWKALKKYPWLKPFAWIYQSCRYIKLAFQNKVTPNKLKAIYDEGNKRNEMFAALGLK